MKRPTVTLDEIKAKVRYSFVGGPFGSNLTTRDYVEEGVPVIRGNNLPTDSTFFDDEFVFVTEQKADELASNTARAGDLIFTQRGTLGQVGLIPTEPRFPLYVISQSQMKLSVDKEKADAKFIYFFFRSPATVQNVINHALISGVPHINLGILKGFEVPLPPLDEQRRIAEVLSAYDDLMENNRRRIALLEEAARQLYAEWFVRLRFPREHAAASENGLPKDWTRGPLGEVADINRETLGSSFHGEIEYVDISAVTPGHIGETTRYDFADAPSRARRVVRHGDIIWSCVRPNRRLHAVIWKPEPNLIVSTGFAVISPKTLPTSFLYQAMTTDAFVRNLENRARGAAYPAVLASDFEQSEIVVPPAPLVNAFNDFAEPLLDQIYLLTFQTQKLRAARDLLLPRLMSGGLAV